MKQIDLEDYLQEQKIKNYIQNKNKEIKELCDFFSKNNIFKTTIHNLMKKYG